MDLLEVSSCLSLSHLRQNRFFQTLQRIDLDGKLTKLRQLLQSLLLGDKKTLPIIARSNSLYFYAALALFSISFLEEKQAELTARADCFVEVNRIGSIERDEWSALVLESIGIKKLKAKRLEGWKPSVSSVFIIMTVWIKSLGSCPAGILSVRDAYPLSLSRMDSALPMPTQLFVPPVAGLRLIWKMSESSRLILTFAGLIDTLVKKTKQMEMKKTVIKATFNFCQESKLTITGARKFSSRSWKISTDIAKASNLEQLPLYTRL